MNLNKLKAQTVLVTGASSGIGKAIAIEMAKAGANVVINFYSGDDDATDTLQQVQAAGADGITIQADVSKEDQVINMFSKAYERFKTIDILVNNAGIEIDKQLVDMTLNDWQRVIDVNLTGQFLCAREAAKEFIKRGIVKDRSVAAGKMIFISSVHDRIPWSGHANYVASKGGVSLFMKSIAQELAPYHIRANCISPGAIKTDINKHVWDDPEKYKQLLEMIPYQRIGMPVDIGKVAVFLASDDADYITGSTIYVDGGMTLYPSFEHGG